MMMYLQPKVLVILLLGISSGLPLTLSASTLSMMLAEKGLDLAKIGMFGLASTPYAFKYVWSPLVDNLHIPKLSKILGRRRSWLFVIQLLLMISICFVGILGVDGDLLLLGVVVLSLSFFSATQDIIIDAYRIEILQDEEQGIGVTAAGAGYRLGMLISGAGSIFLAEYCGWCVAYCVIALLLIPGGVAAFIYGEPKIPGLLTEEKKLFHWIRHAFFEPFEEFASRKGWIFILLFVLFYRLSDAYLGMMTTPFLLEMGFSKIEIASIIKIYGFVAVLVGMAVGGYFVAKWKNLADVLLLGLVVQCSSNLIFILQHYYGHNVPVLILVISVENLCSSISGAAFISYISTLVNREFTATHYALLSSLAVVARTTISSSAGFVVEAVGWVDFFIVSAIISLPAFLLLYHMHYRQSNQNLGKR